VLFAWLEGYRNGLELVQADRVLFMADGDPWIRKRVRVPIEHLGLGAERAVQAVDYYHAVERPTTAVKETAWSDNTRMHRLMVPVLQTGFLSILRDLGTSAVENSGSTARWQRTPVEIPERTGSPGRRGIEDVQWPGASGQRKIFIDIH
jgi:hypothetical protein